jgi:hypothetical protein
MQAATDWSKSVRVEVRGGDVVGHAGNVLPRMLAEPGPHQRLVRGVVTAGGDPRPGRGVEGRGGVDRGRYAEPGRYRGAAGSGATVRAGGIGSDDVAIAQRDRPPGMAGIALVRNRVRERVWRLIEARHGAIPPSRTCYGDLGPVVVIRIDASLVESHSVRRVAEVTWSNATRPLVPVTLSGRY